MTIKFTKLHGAGNDFVFIDGREGLPFNIPTLARRLCNRHLGIGADGLIFLYKNDKAEVAMHYSNSDGSPTTCGNGIRLIGRYAEMVGEWSPDKKTLTVDTVGGIVKVERADREGYYTVNMGRPRFDASEIPYNGIGPVKLQEMTVEGHRYVYSAVNMGNPHCIIFVPNLDEVPLEQVGPIIEHNPLFPAKVNAAFVQILSRNSVKMNIWERGVGVTLACGTSNCGILAVGVREGLLDREIKLESPGGEFIVRWDEETDDIYLTGPTAEVFSGELAN